jgi:cell division protein FtsL
MNTLRAKEQKEEEEQQKADEDFNRLELDKNTDVLRQVTKVSDLEPGQILDIEDDYS